MFLFEAVRLSDIDPFSSNIMRFYSYFIDEKDSGTAVTSHFYLLLGCSISIWTSSSLSVPSLSGLLTIGISDAVASIVGSKFGKHKWFGTKKSVEGTLGNDGGCYSPE
ncbi:Dolichol kinase sec59 [Smittium mucronatum]|uniref:dolichol kinase n=1 Tax=Smittium mucronatum TaxID=133383 RepID=A0A1R0H641_9FUNG|nr:Dolichol kinase sec59 [Smittium mucronatum]